MKHRANNTQVRPSTTPIITTAGSETPPSALMGAGVGLGGLDAMNMSVVGSAALSGLPFPREMIVILVTDGLVTVSVRRLGCLPPRTTVGVPWGLLIPVSMGMMG